MCSMAISHVNQQSMFLDDMPLYQLVIFQRWQGCFSQRITIICHQESSSVILHHHWPLYPSFMIHQTILKPSIASIKLSSNHQVPAINHEIFHIPSSSMALSTLGSSKPSDGSLLAPSSCTVVRSSMMVLVPGCKCAWQVSQVAQLAATTRLENGG